tara:strand:+ start:111 stop:296 length:186 start_codon:yes stop_codon:yes gene_type:complete
MTHHLTDKIEATKTELQAVVDEHNKLVEKKQELLNKATELQGALKALNELNEDQPTEGESS